MASSFIASEGRAEVLKGCAESIDLGQLIASDYGIAERIDEDVNQAIVRRSSSHVTFAARQKVFDPFPAILVGNGANC